MNRCLRLLLNRATLVIQVTNNTKRQFNELDGLENNNAIVIIATTNHLEKLDPGLSKRPSRFDRKYGLPPPSNEERTMYCEFWRHKLKGNKSAVFPKELCPKIVKIIEGFSFAYMKEAFVATLLAVARREDDDGLDDESEEVGEHFKNKNGDDIEDLIL